MTRTKQQLVLTDQRAKVYQNGKKVAEGPMHLISQWVDDMDQLRYTKIWNRAKRIKKAKKARQRANLINTRHLVIPS